MHEIFGISMAHPMDSASCNWMVYVGFPVPRRWWCSRTRDGGRIITSQYTGPCPFGPKIASEADQPRDLAGLAWTCPKCQTFCSLPKLMCFWAFLGDFPDFLFHLKFCHLSKCQAVGLSGVPGIASRRLDIWRDRCDRRSRKFLCELRKCLGKQREMLYNFTPKLRNFTDFA